MSKPTKSLKTMCKKLGVRLTIKRGQKRVYKSVAVLKKQCAKKKKAKGKRKVKRRRRRRRRFGTYLTEEDLKDPKYHEGATKLQALFRGYQSPARKQARKEKAERRARMMQYLKYAGVGLGGAGLGALGGYHYRGRRRRFGRKKGQGLVYDQMSYSPELQEGYEQDLMSYSPKIRRRQEAAAKERMSAAKRAKLMKYLKYAGLGTAGLGTVGLGGYAGYRYYKRRGKKKKGKKKKGKKK